jgi:hypothetical protein
MTWRGTTTGEFIVRSAYYMEKNRIDVVHGECSHQWKTVPVMRGLEDLLVPSGEIHWQSPPTGTYKANWDVIDSKNGKLGFGCIMRDF